ncbi:putative ZDHHC-type palmitoyltransferase 5 isoform X2 [Mya arenaria]|uniref:putative ZDHHC-type palmitoyltransferase 5 isoform X2 n=1 Tax=Mya arenaria TaxID=6604 RepID=UPI0022E369AC|nr:putative ZDHHC-type palmitoyltransferase 5 isoform X2 [Mya arenaria]
MNAQNPAGPQGTEEADLHVLLHAVSTCSGLAVQQIITQKPHLLNMKGWHGHTPLHKACLSGDVNMVKLLCEFGADTNIRNDFQETPVHYAAKRGIPTLVNILRYYGAKLDARDTSGKTPVHNAAQTGSVYMLKYFEEQGFGFRDVDDSGQTPLHCSCQFGHLEAFKFLLKKGRTDPSIQDKEGNTALHICIREGYAHGTWLLIQYLGLSCLQVPNRQGLTAQDILEQFETSKKPGHKVIGPLLKELSKQPKNKKQKGPVGTWYFNLLMPTVLYALAILLAEFVIYDYQGVVFLFAVGFIVRTASRASHRLNHVSRWSNPLFAGTFAAGMLHTMLLAYCKIMPDVFGSLEFYLIILLNIGQIYLYYQLLKADPGVVTSSIADEKTGQPMTLTQLCDSIAPLDQFCTDCEIVRMKTTKHCKLCERCYYRMDHHCLFLLKCIGYKNHARFVWFIIMTVFNMGYFLVKAVMYSLVKYNALTYSEIAIRMFQVEGWMISMICLNIVSAIWATNLIHYQLNVVSRGHTSYFQRDVSTLTPMEKVTNVINFLLGKPLILSDLDFNLPKKNLDLDRNYVHNV